MVETKINIGGDTIKLKYPNRACRDLDKRLGYSAMHIVEKIHKHGVMAPFGLDDVSIILWAGMITDKPALDVDEVVDMLPLKIADYQPIAEKAVRIITEIYGIEDAEVEAAEAGSGKDKGRGTGKSSKK